MDTSGFKEYIFGMLFLKRTSDQFDVAQEEVRKRGKALGLTYDQFKEMSESPGEPEYANSFFVPVKACWANILQLHDNMGGRVLVDSDARSASSGWKSSQREVFDQVIQGITIPFGYRGEYDAHALPGRFVITDLAVGLKRKTTADPDVDGGAEGQVITADKQSADAQVVRGILDPNRVRADVEFHPLVEQHPWERARGRAFHVCTSFHLTAYRKALAACSRG